jgi:hypothetical protein
LPSKGSFAEELTAAENTDHGLFSLRGNHAQLDLAALYVADEVRSIALREHHRILL